MTDSVRCLSAPLVCWGQRLLEEEMKHREETADTTEGLQVDSRALGSSCRVCWKGPLGVYLPDDCNCFLSLS